MTPTNIRGKNIELTPAIKEHVEQRVEKVEKYFDRITMVNVEVRKSEHHKNGFFSCKVNLDVPKHRFHAEETKGDLHDAIDSVFSIVERELKKHKEQMQQERRTSGREDKRVA